MRYNAPWVEVTTTTTSPRPFFSRARQGRTPPRPTHSIPSHHTTSARPCLSTSPRLLATLRPTFPSCKAMQSRRCFVGSASSIRRFGHSAPPASASLFRAPALAVRRRSFAALRVGCVLASARRASILKKILQDRLTWRAQRFVVYASHFCWFTRVCDRDGLMLPSTCEQDVRIKKKNVT